MNGKSAAVLAVATATLMSLAGCGAAAAVPLATLSTTNKLSNAGILTDFVGRACIDAAAKPGRFPAMLDETRWPRRQTQAAGAKTPLNVWKLPHITLVHSGVPIDAPVARIWTCSVEVDAQTAPPRGSMEVALRRIASRDLFDSLPGDWHWKPSTFTEAHLTVEQGTTPGSLMIFVEYADIKPLKALLGN